MVKKKRPASYRQRISRRIARADNQKSKLKELTRARRAAEKELKRLQRQIGKEERRLKKLKRRRATVALNKKRERARKQRRQLKTLTNLRQIITRRKRARGRKQQRKAKIATVERKSQGRKFGTKKTYTFNHFNHQANYTAIGTWLGILKAETRLGIKGFYITAQINGKMKHITQAGALTNTDPELIKALDAKDFGKVKKLCEQFMKEVAGKFMWFNLLALAGYGVGKNVDVIVIDKSAEAMVNDGDWSVWADSGLPQIRSIVISMSEVKFQ